MRAVKSVLGAAAAIAILTGCGGNYGASAINQATLVDVQANSQLEFRVGTALFPDGTVGLNTLATFRSTTGGIAATVNTPIITGPAGFVVPDNAQTDPPPSSPSTKNTDVGTNTIRGTPIGNVTVTTFGTTGGAFAYGFANINEVFGTNPFPQFVGTSLDNTALYQDTDSTIVVGSGKGHVQTTISATLGDPKMGAIGNAYTIPLYAPEQSRLPFLLGPPAVPDFHNANFSNLFLGYYSGFVAFAAAPVAGTYSLQVIAPSTAQQSAASFTQNATLSTVTPLGAEATAPTIASTGDGGATFTVAAPPAGVTNQLLYVVDVSITDGVPTFYTLPVPAGGGTLTLSAKSGPVVSGTVTTPFALNDSVYAYVLGSDYDVLAPSQPGNVAEAPVLPTQADITISKATEVVYPAIGVSGPLLRRRAH